MRRHSHSDSFLPDSKVARCACQAFLHESSDGFLGEADAEHVSQPTLQECRLHSRNVERAGESLGIRQLAELGLR